MKNLMKTAFVLCTIVLTGVLFSEPSFAQDNFPCRPGKGQIALYEHSNYDGKCVIVQPGIYSSSSTLPIRNDTASSVLVGPNTIAMLCKDSRFQGGCENLRHDDPNLGNNRIGHDKLTSLKVKRGWAFCIPGQYEVAIFEDYNYTGNCAVLPIGNYYTIKQINDAAGLFGVEALRQDSISSVWAGPLASATLYEHPDFKGSRSTINDYTSSLSHWNIGNDRMSSLKVR